MFRQNCESNKLRKIIFFNIICSLFACFSVNTTADWYIPANLNNQSNQAMATNYCGAGRWVEIPEGLPRAGEIHCCHNKILDEQYPTLKRNNCPKAQPELPWHWGTVTYITQDNYYQEMTSIDMSEIEVVEEINIVEQELSDLSEEYYIATKQGDGVWSNAIFENIDDVLSSDRLLKMALSDISYRRGGIEHKELVNGYWTDWLNRDYPSGSGDYEIRSLFPGVCANPIDVRCATFEDVDWTETGENVTCTPENGLVCVNQSQDDLYCENYKVAFLCLN
jgi:hypothetical protein